MKIGVYIHIPFCTAKCSYCDFASFALGEDIQRKYVAALKNEIVQVSKKFTERSVDGDADLGLNDSVLGVAEEWEVDTVFIGGGTPSALYRGGITEIVEELKKHLRTRPIEFTVEANPESVSADFVDECARVGVNRISLGLQTASDHLLSSLRRHTFGDFKNAVAIIRKAGIENINADVMLALPNQQSADVCETICRLVEMNIPHISVYALKVEEGTPLQKSGYIPDDENSAEFYDVAYNLLCQNSDGAENKDLQGTDKGNSAERESEKFDWTGCKNSGGAESRNSADRGDRKSVWTEYNNSNGAENKNFHVARNRNSNVMGNVDSNRGANYIRYEVSNFSKSGFECRHNLKYWQMQPYIGFGLSASSYFAQKRTTNTRDLHDYIDGKYVGFVEDASDNFLTEYIMLGLRTSYGISLKTLAQKGLKIDAHAGFQKHLRSGALITKGDRIILNPSLYYIMNTILSDLI